MRDLPGRLRTFVLLTCALSAVTVAVIGKNSRVDFLGADCRVCIALSVLVLVGELRPIVVTRRDTVDEVTLSTSFVLALMFVGSLWLAIVVMCLAVGAEDIRSGKPRVKLAFNVAQYALALSAAGGCYGAMTGQSVFHQFAALQMPKQLPAALAAGFVFFTVNTVLTVAVTAMALGKPLGHRLRSDLRFQVATAGLLLTFAPVLAFCVQVTAWLLPLLVLPMVAIYVSAQAAARRETEALHDALTGLANRTLFGVRVDRLCGQPRAGGQTLAAVMLLDLDHFKEINDTLGHHVGDELLRAVGARLSVGLRDGDTVARLGGDEFAVLAVDLASLDAAVEVGERVLEALAEPFTVDGVLLNVEGSVGIALFPDHGDRMDLLLRQADIALYAAKVERACCRVYDPTEDPHTLERLALATDLRAGLDRRELFLAYQPQIEVSTGRVVGFEALVRWQHPRLGLLMPDDFLPVVENTGLIGPMTLEVLGLALAAAAEWGRNGHDVSVAVNLSARHLTDLSLPQQIGQLLLQHELSPRRLGLEVTETLIMTDPNRAVAVLALLRAIGIGLAVDDFGTGYSSLSYLRRLNVDVLKIDKSFVTNVHSSEEDAVIVRSTIELGHNLGLQLVAEGVEDQAALSLLTSWGCDLVQGYHVGRPMPGEQVLGWLASYEQTRRELDTTHPLVTVR